MTTAVKTLKGKQETVPRAPSWLTASYDWGPGYYFLKGQCTITGDSSPEAPRSSSGLLTLKMILTFIM